MCEEYLSNKAELPNVVALFYTEALCQYLDENILITLVMCSHGCIFLNKAEFN